MESTAGRILVFDPSIAGISGDMIVAALLDLGASSQAVLPAMRLPLDCVPGCKTMDISVADVQRNGIKAKKLDIRIEEQTHHMPAPELLQAASLCLQRLSLTDAAKALVMTSLECLVSAEATVHGYPVEDVMLHETASADTLADAIGAAAALDDLHLLTETAVYTTPIAVGGGSLTFSHGTVAAPAPATLEVLRGRGLHIVGGPVQAELATPTGVSVLAALDPQPVLFYPSMRPMGVGYGAGTRDFHEIPNVLRIALGQPCHYGLSTDRVCVIESNVDDVPGELIAHVTDVLLEAGARDVSVTPMLTKKGRPGYAIKVIVDSPDADRLASVLMRETGTLGVRLQECSRRVLSRDSFPIDVQVGGVAEVVHIKVARDTDGRVIQVKPEYDDLKRVATRTAMPLRDVERLVRGMAERTVERLLGLGGTDGT
jgi:uncharacterized protein (TIGR00299 family) protein